MSWPVSGPNAAGVGRWWLRRTPGCSVITSPSSQDIRAISSSMCRRSATASSARGVAGQRRRGRCARPRRRRAGRCATSSWLWSAESAPCATKYRRRSSIARDPARGSRRCRRRRPRRAGRPRRPSRAAPARGSGRAGTSGSPGPATSGRRRARRARPGRRTGRRWWPAPRCRTARTARAAGRRPRASRVGELVVDRVGGLRRRAHGHAEDLRQLRLEPVARRACRGTRASARTAAARRARASSSAAAPCPTPSASSGTPVGVQQPGHVVVRASRTGVAGSGNGSSSSSSRGSTCPCGEIDRQVAHGVVQPPRDRAHPGLGRQQPVGMQRERGDGAVMPTYRRAGAAIGCHSCRARPVPNGRRQT